MNNLSLKGWGLDSKKYTFNERLLGLIIGIIIFSVAFICLFLIDFICFIQFFYYKTIPELSSNFLLAFFFCVFVLVVLFITNYQRTRHEKGNRYVVITCMATFLGLLLNIILDFFIQLFFAKIYVNQLHYTFQTYLKQYWLVSWPEYLVIAILLIIIFVIRRRILLYKLNVQRHSSDTSENLGTARMATEKDISRYNLRNKKGGLLGKDRLSYLRMPKLTDRLILAYRGTGKTSSLLMPFIIDHPHVNKLITDVKGELTAVTARYSAKNDRKIYVIDPFNVLKSLGLDIKTHHINPFAYINFDDPLEKDRYIAALASALCSGDYAVRSETEAHFMENAQIILEGVLDYYVETNRNCSTKFNFVGLHDWWLEAVNDDEGKLFAAIKETSSKSLAAFSQLFAAGRDETGSMKTTVYRQLQWLRSDNIRKIFVDDDIDIQEFILGECDIYVVLPEDMIKAYSRVVRLIMALIKVKLIQAPIKDIKKDYCFVLDEIGQFGYCPDIEQVIAALRGRGVKVWASFQTLDQIEQYRDESTFKGMPVKHFLGGDDIKTLEWIQQLGSTKTVLTENVSRNINSSAGRGSKTSVSENHAVSETATNLIKFNDVREMADDEQYIFIRGMRPIRCKKAFYFKEQIYKGRYDSNPIEER
jgi:type IV secretory pathway TraG/TraD family ATPase VirD4